MKKILAALLLFMISPGIYGEAENLYPWKKFSERHGAALLSWLEAEAVKMISGNGTVINFPHMAPPYYGRVGIFVTILKGKKVRGCFGGFNHQNSDFSGTLRRYLKGALRSDPRYAPLGIEELEDANIIVTIASQPEGIKNIEYIDLERCGVVYSYQDGSRAVIVPAEVRTVAYLKKIAENKGVLSRASFRAVTIKRMKARIPEGASIINVEPE